MDPFQIIKPTEITDNVFKLLDKDWMLVTAGTLEDYNTMTASWGHMGIMWNLPIAIAWIRPQRYTYEFVNRYRGVHPLLFHRTTTGPPCSSAAPARAVTMTRPLKPDSHPWRPTGAM